MKYYHDKTQLYFQEIRHYLLSLVPEIKTNKILEVGAASRNLLVAIKALGLAREVIGIDIFNLPNTN